jgi:chemotaxis protein CheC
MVAMIEGYDPLDILTELSTIGAGNAAGAMSKLTGKRVEIKVPDAYSIRIDEVPQTVGFAQKTASVVAELSGEKEGYLLLLLEEPESLDLVKLLIDGDAEELGDMEKSALIEVGNIMAGTFIGALSRFLRAKIMEKPPSLKIGNVSAMVLGALEGRDIDRNVWLAKIEFIVGECRLRGHMLFIPLFDFSRDAIARVRV